MAFRATLNLLTSSVLLAVSAGFKLFVAFVLLGSTPNPFLCVSFVLLSYFVYTFDRVSGGEEDEVNRPELRDASQKIGLAVSGLALLTSALLATFENLSPFVVLIPVVIGYLYSKGVSIGDRSLTLKGGLGAKNLVVGFTWGATILAFTHRWSDLVTLTLLFIFFSTKSFINTVLYDCRDIKGDRDAGIRTLPVHLGKDRTRLVLETLNSLLHIGLLTAAFFGMAELSVPILVFSFLLGTLYIWAFSSDRRTSWRDVFVDGEWVLLAAARRLYLSSTRFSL